MNDIFSRGVITNPEELFGRHQLLDRLVVLANNKYCVSITGLRRFGKTSTLQCLMKIIKEKSTSRVYPVYFDFKEVGAIIKGTKSAYKYMISKLIMSLVQDYNLDGEESFGLTRIKYSQSWEDLYEQLDGVNLVRVQSLLEDVVVLYSRILEKTILFLFDEYEYLFKYTFDEPVGFMKLRSITSSINYEGRQPLSFWIAGALSWDYLCSLTGSGELNVIDGPPVYIGSIEYDSFCEMWKNEISKFEKSDHDILSLCDYAYNASGGIPFYGKLIANYCLTNKNKPEYYAYNSYFNEMIGVLKDEEIRIIKECSLAPRKYENNAYAINLLEKGILAKKGQIYSVKSNYLCSYFKNKANNETSEQISVIESYRLTDKIAELIRTINNTNYNKRNRYIFTPVNDDSAILKDIRTPCYSREVFSDFASSLYKIIFEKTQVVRNGRTISKGLLPKAYKKDNVFIKIVDILRHSFGGGHLMHNFNIRPGQMSKSQMLNYLTGSKNEPQAAEEYYNLQIKILKMFESELVKLNSIINAIL